MAVVTLDVEPDPIAIARRLEASNALGIAVLHDAEGRGSSWVAACPDAKSNELDPTLGDFDKPNAPGAPRWIGVLPYEAFRTLERPSWSPTDDRPQATIARPSWHRYAAVIRLRRGEAPCAIGDENGVRELVDRLRSPSRRSDATLDLLDDEAPSRHAERIAAAKELIVAGDLYQVNVARRIRAAFHGESALSLYERLIATAPTSLGAYLALDDGVRVLSTSPEILLRASPKNGVSSGPFGEVYTQPIKGTRPRGRDEADDRRLARELDEDPKERAELSMIIDVERNDLGTIAETGTVELVEPPHVRTLPTVHHRFAAIRCTPRADVDRATILRAMLPSGSVTGAPKRRAMEVIRTLESHRRGLYTGGIGYIDGGGRMVLSMAIRTLVLAGDEGEYFAGGGIVADSDPWTEVEETRWKSLQLVAACRS